MIERYVEGPAHVVGNSAGGNVVLNLLATRPDLITTASVHEPGPVAVAEDGGGHGSELIERDRLHMERVRRLIEGRRHRAAAEYFMNEVAVGAGAWEPFAPELQDILVSNAETVINDLCDAHDPESIDLKTLTGSTVPLLISAGGDSPELEALSSRRLAARLPSASLHIIAGAGHIPHRTCPDRYASMVTDFTSAGRVPAE